MQHHSSANNFLVNERKYRLQPNFDWPPILPPAEGPSVLGRAIQAVPAPRYLGRRFPLAHVCKFLIVTMNVIVSPPLIYFRSDRA